jgi:hypothetical protein
MAKIFDLNVEAGATFTISFRYKDNNGTPFDLSDYTVQAQVRNSDTDALVFTPSIETVDVDGLVTMVFTATQTSAFDNNPYVYGVELHGDDVIRLVQGKVFVSPEVVK